jgi:RNA polymerase sigma factor (sigma-70 family)
MLVNIVGIGDQKIKYKNPKEIKFDDLSVYLNLAKKSISKFANRYYNGLSVKMLKDEDAIADVANAIIMADWRYDENHEGKEGQKKTKYSYRNQCAIWAIQTYVTKSHGRKPKALKNKKAFSLDYTAKDDDTSFISCVIDQKHRDPASIIVEKENKENLCNLIQELLSVSSISEKQKEFIKLYYFEGNTFEQIGKKFNLTREAIRQSINKALSVIRDIA